MLDRRKCWGFRWEASLFFWAPFCKENQFHLFPCSIMFHHVPPCSTGHSFQPSICLYPSWMVVPTTLRTKLRSLAPWSSIPPSCDPGQNRGGDLPVAPRRLCCDVAKGSIRVVGAVVLSKCLDLCFSSNFYWLVVSILVSWDEDSKPPISLNGI